MKISVFKVTYHTITEAVKDDADKNQRKGQELRRTSPVVTLIAGESLEKALICLPERAEGTRNVVIQSVVLHRDVPFQESVAPLPQAIKREPWLFPNAGKKAS